MPYSGIFSADGNYLFIPNNSTGSLSVVDTKTFERKEDILMEKPPESIVVFNFQIPTTTVEKSIYDIVIKIKAN